MIRFLRAFNSVVFFIAASCSAFSNKKSIRNPIADLFQKINSLQTTEPPTQKNDPEVLLNELNIQASMKPQLAYARVERIPTLLLACVAPVLRQTSGVFPCEYQIKLVDKNEPIYTYASFGNKQLSETGFSNIPPIPLELYEFESDADSRLVREACSMLSLVVTIYPIPIGGPRYRANVVPNLFETSSKSTSANNNIPYLFDPNTQVKIAGSRRIVDYIFTKYGPPGMRNIPQVLQQPTTGMNWPRVMAAVGVSFARGNAGGRYIDSRFHDPVNVQQQQQPLILWAYEGSPFCKVVRETLSAYEIPHTVYFTPRGSINRQKLYDLTGRFQVPYLQDPNTGINLFESEAIVEYLDKQYGLTRSAVKYM
jgi:Glutathione S-transferase, N-terminal domain